MSDQKPTKINYNTLQYAPNVGAILDTLDGTAANPLSWQKLGSNDLSQSVWNMVKKELETKVSAPGIEPGSTA